MEEDSIKFSKEKLQAIKEKIRNLEKTSSQDNHLWIPVWMESFTDDEEDFIED